MDGQIFTVSSVSSQKKSRWLDRLDHEDPKHWDSIIHPERISWFIIILQDFTTSKHSIPNKFYHHVCCLNFLIFDVQIPISNHIRHSSNHPTSFQNSPFICLICFDYYHLIKGSEGSIYMTINILFPLIPHSQCSIMFPHFGRIFTLGYESKPWYPSEPQITGKWMFIPPNIARLVLIHPHFARPLVMVLGNIVRGKRSTLNSDTAVKAAAGVRLP